MGKQKSLKNDYGERENFNMHNKNLTKQLFAGIKLFGVNGSCKVIFICKWADSHDIDDGL